MSLHNWIVRNLLAGNVYYGGNIEGIDIYYPIRHPWMMDNDPTRPCGCDPIHDPVCETADDD